MVHSLRETTAHRRQVHAVANRSRGRSRSTRVDEESWVVPEGACRRAPARGRHCSNAGGLNAVGPGDYTGNACPTCLRACSPARRIMTLSLRFPEPCGRPGLQPSLEHVPGGLVISAIAIAPAAAHAVAFDLPDAQFDDRWREWKARGRAHEQRVRGRLVVSLAIALPLALAVLLPEPGCCDLVKRLVVWLDREAPPVAGPLRDELLSIERLEERALALAASFTLDPNPRRRARDTFPALRRQRPRAARRLPHAGRDVRTGPVRRRRRPSGCSTTSTSSRREIADIRRNLPRALLPRAADAGRRASTPATRASTRWRSS